MTYKAVSVGERPQTTMVLGWYAEHDSEVGNQMGSDELPEAGLTETTVIDDAEMWAVLEAAGYAGEEYEMFVIKMTKVTLPVLSSMILNGKAFKKLKELRRDKHPSLWEKVQIQRDPQAARQLASDAQAITLRRFLKSAQSGSGWGGWQPDSGANMTSWFITGCILDLSNVYEKWRQKLPPPETSFEELEPFLAERAREDISSKSLLGDLTETEIEILMLRINDKWKHKEIAELEGISEAASQARFRRAKSKLRRFYRR